MKLSYRGLNYALQTVAIDTVETELTARFRGLQYAIRRPANLHTLSTGAKKYRGVAYN